MSDSRCAGRNRDRGNIACVISARTDISGYGGHALCEDNGGQGLAVRQWTIVIIATTVTHILWDGDAAYRSVFNH